VSAPFRAPFHIATTRTKDETFVRVRGELDLATCPELEAVLAAESATGGTLVLDLSELEFIDSTGIGLLFAAWRESQRDGFELRLTRGSDLVMRALQICGLRDELPFAEAQRPGPPPATAP
jgi:anti-sigma B factor antagonist